MAVDPLFEQTQLLVQGASAANAVPTRRVEGMSLAVYDMEVSTANTTPGSGCLVFGAAGQLTASSETSEVGGYVLSVMQHPGAVATAIEAVVEAAWSPGGNLLSAPGVAITGDDDVADRYSVFVTKNGAAFKTGAIQLSAGKSYIRVQLNTAAMTVDVVVTPDGGSPIAYGFPYFTPVTEAYPFVVGGAKAVDVVPSAAQASASVSLGPAGLSITAIAAEFTLRAIIDPTVQLLGGGFLPIGRVASGGSATISGFGAEHTVQLASKDDSSAGAELVAGFMAALQSAGFACSSTALGGGAYKLSVFARSPSDEVLLATPPEISGTSEILAQGYDLGGNFFSRTDTFAVVGRVDVGSPARFGSSVAVNQVTHFSVFVADPSRDYTLTAHLDTNHTGWLPTQIASVSLKGDVAGGLAALSLRLGIGVWNQVQPGLYVATHVADTPGPRVAALFLRETVETVSAVSKLYGVRVTAAGRYDDAFPALPWPTTSVPSSVGTSNSEPDPENVVLQLLGDASGGVFPYDSSTRHYGATLSSITPSTSPEVDGLGIAFSNYPSRFYSDAIAELATVGTEPFCIRAFVYQTARSFNGAFIYSGATVAEANAAYRTTSAPWVVIENGGTLAFGAAGVYATTTATVPLNTLVHIAVTRDSAGTLRGFIDGVLSASVSAPGAAPSSVALFGIASNSASGSQFAGLMKDIQVVVGEPVYVTDYTPAFIGSGGPVPSGNADLAGYHTLDDFVGSGSFHQQANHPAAYFSGAVTLGAAVASGDAYTLDGNGVAISGSAELDGCGGDGAFLAGVPVTFDGAATLDDGGAAASFYSGPPVELTGASDVEGMTQIAVFMHLASAEFSGDATLDGAASSSALFSLIDPVVWRLNAAVPAATLMANATQFLVNATVPAATLRARVSAYRGLSLNAMVPAASVSARTGLVLRKSVPAAVLSSSATVSNTLRLDARLARVTGQAVILSGSVLRVGAQVPAATVSAWTGIQMAGTVPVATCRTSAVVGGAFRLRSVVPAAMASMVVSSMNVLRLSGVIPAAVRGNWVALERAVPAARLMGVISPVVATTRVAYSFTVANRAMTRYPAYPFIQVIRMGNSFFGVAEDGLHEIGGTTDNDSPIPWAWETCMTDFGMAQRKTVVSAYLGGYVPQAMTYTIRSGDVPAAASGHSTSATTVLRNHRQKFGIGRKSRFFAFGLSAAAGRVAIEGIEFEVAVMSRRI